jgi:hypothetical protein
MAGFQRLTGRSDPEPFDCLSCGAVMEKEGLGKQMVWGRLGPEASTRPVASGIT